MNNPEPSQSTKLRDGFYYVLLDLTLTNETQMKEVFLTIAMVAHGYASIIANNSLEYDESVISVHLQRAYRGAVLALQEEEK